MPPVTSSSLAAPLAAAAQAAELAVVASEPAVSKSGIPTTRFTLAPAATVTDADADANGDTVEPAAKTCVLELSNAFNISHPDFAAQLAIFLNEARERMRNPRPNFILTLNGIPLSYTHFEWPFHESTAGADTSVVHGQVQLEDGSSSSLYAKIAAAMTVTFREVVRAPEQPFAESFILNAVRKTFDQGQLELVKSGNRQPVPVTTRYYWPKQQKFIFNDTNETQRKHFLAGKVYWLSGVLGGGEPVWLLDPRDAQYLNTTVEDLANCAQSLVNDGQIALAADAAFARPTPELLERKAEFEVDLAEALDFIKPSFNEQMRGGHTNM